MDNVTIQPPATGLSSITASSEAMMRATKVWANGYKKLGDIMADTAKGHLNQTASVWQAMSHAKTVKELVTVQTDYFRTTSEHSVASAKKLVEATNEFTHDIMAPALEK